MSKNWFCKICFLLFDKQYVFDLHLSLVHGEKIEVKVESPICEENLQESQNSKTKFSYQPVHGKEKPFKGNECYVSFTKTSNLKNHMESVQKGKKPFNCDFCDKILSQKQYLSRHIESVHEGKKPFKCNICVTSFSIKGTLKVHIESVHNGEKPYIYM